MASIVKRNGNFCVVYSYKEADGTAKQKWETFSALSDARLVGKKSSIKNLLVLSLHPSAKR